MTATISSNPSSVASAPAYSPALNEARSLAHAKATLNSLPVGSTINHLSHALGGIRLDLGASRAAPDDGPQLSPADGPARQAALRYAEIEATTKAAANAPDGRAE